MRAMPCFDPKGAKERIASSDASITMLPDIVLTSDTKIIRFANGDKQVYGFTQVGSCAVPKVYWLGPYIPTAGV